MDSHEKTSPVEEITAAVQSTSLSTASFTPDTTKSLAKLPTLDALELLCPLAVLAVCAHAWQPKSSDVLARSFAALAEGTYGRVSVGFLPKKLLSPSLSTLSGRTSIFPGDFELVTVKAPKLMDTWKSQDVLGDSEAPTIPFRNMLSELAFLSAPRLLYHENIVDLLGYFWEPSGGSVSKEARLAPTLVLEFADQGSLRTFMDYGTAISPSEKLGLCLDICRALQTLHHELAVLGKPVGLFHGDLKPENILIFKNADESGYTAKLCDLGSCLRYEHDQSFLLNSAGPGTPAWMAPELSSLGGMEEKVIRPAACDAYSFGLLVAYMFLEKDLFRIRPVAEFLLQNWVTPSNGKFSPTSVQDILDASDKIAEANIRTNLQRMIHSHPSKLQDSILDEISTLTLSERERGIVRTLVEQTVRVNSDERLADFAVLTTILGGDPGQTRSRTPIQPVLDTFANPGYFTYLTGRKWAMAMINSIGTMPWEFRLWLGGHLEAAFEHLLHHGGAESRVAQSYIATLRGLLSFCPPAVAAEANEGISWLLKAADLGDLNCALLADRLAGACNIPLNSPACSAMIHQAAQDGSIIAQTMLQCLPPDQEAMTDAEQEFHSRLLERFATETVWPQHSLAFVRSTKALDNLIANFVDQGWDLDAESRVGIDAVNGGYLTYSATEPGTALLWAVQMNNTAAVAALVHAGASPYGDTGSPRKTAWFVAVEARLLPIIEILVEFCPCNDEEARRNSTHEALFSGLPRAFLNCGTAYVERTFDMFQYLFSHNLLSREQAYKSTTALCAGDPRLLQKLLEDDYPAHRDETLLRSVLVNAVQTSDSDATILIVPLIRKLQSTDPFDMYLLHQAVISTGRRSLEICLSLLEHVHSNFCINARYSMLGATAEIPAILSCTQGATLLHWAFSHGNIDHAIELLRRGADPAVAYVDPTNPAKGTINAFAQLLIPQTHYNYLALCRFLKSHYVKQENPIFVLDQAIMNPETNHSILHLLCGDEDTRLHNSPHRMAYLQELLRHLRGLSSHRSRILKLLNLQMLHDGEKGMTALHLAADSGFHDAVKSLVAAGADAMFRIAADPAIGHPGVTALHVVDMRDVTVWDEQWDIREGVLRRGGVPWLSKTSPVAKKLRAEYENRTHATMRELEAVLKKIPAGRDLLAKRAAFAKEHN
ncbi:hypothetical protein EDB81DRAFT_721027 [Dactylonectria macrodidyma]|uniref:Protein kinase domain-containing protein n=1 Tax=Dactylonectria macrodidyma TaxID=307937 RepID=A0A9P9EWX6_9HYPO|nr:hypothetical protein EDB81DRAFT_721027 [Dactylonectria macrodidyma]